jgi:hypothetical protein
MPAIRCMGDRSTRQARYTMLRATASPEITAFTPGPGPVTSLAFSPDGTTLANGDNV